MNLKTLLGSCLAASLLAACSGGGGSVAPANGIAGGSGAPVGGGQGIQLKIGAPINMGTSTSSRRSPKFVGTNVTSIDYTFLPGPISGSFTNSGPNTFTGCTPSGATPPIVQTCDVIAGPGTYSLTITLKQGGVVVGSGTASNIMVTSGTLSPVSVSIDPVNSAPAISIPGTPKIFYNDGTPQMVNLTANELDPAGDIITTYYGPVGNYPTLMFNDSGGIANITLPAPNPIVVAPAGVNGNVNQGVAYTGSGNATSLTVTLSDGTSTSQVVIPYVSIADNASNPTPGNITFTGIGASNTQTVTVTESTTSGTTGLDSNFTSSSAITACGTHASFSPALGTNATTVVGSNASVTYTITDNDTGIISCELDVASAADPALTVPITLNVPGSVGVGVTSHSRH